MKNIFLFLYEIILCDSIGQNRLGNNIKIIELSSKPVLTKSFLMVSILSRLVKNGRERNVIKTILNNVRKPEKVHNGRLKAFIENHHKKAKWQVTFLTFLDILASKYFFLYELRKAFLENEGLIENGLNHSLFLIFLYYILTFNDVFYVR